jgi:hypothetical protein|uniref:AN1-type domain-containing protein n=1 Tax=viral metagenome TaxID=1070528 RepID=A0A6C0IVM5_9ZZZZ
MASGKTFCQYKECTKRLNFVELSTTGRCKCLLLFCYTHREPAAHQCSFDYHAQAKVILTKQNQRVEAPKMIDHC